MPAFKKLHPALLPGVTTADIAKAEADLARCLQNPAFTMTSGPRRAALYAKMQCGMHITAFELAEFASVIPADYKAHTEQNAQASAAIAVAQREAREKWEAEERLRQAAAAKKQRALEDIRDPREAQNSLDPATYAKWCQTPTGMRAIAELYG